MNLLSRCILLFVLLFGVVNAQVEYGLDTTYGLYGKVKLESISANGVSPYSVLSQDDKLYVLFFTKNDSSSNIQGQSIIRLLENGQIDSTWCQNGIYYNDDLDYVIASIVVQPDGKLLTAGVRNAIGYGMGMQGFIKRFLVNGAIDSTFGLNGTIIESGDPNWTDLGIPFVAFTGVEIVNNKIMALGIDSNGSILRMQTFNIFDGAIDSTWGNNGVIRGIFNHINSNAVPTRKNITVGINGEIFLIFKELVLKFSSQGILDTSFGNNGHLTPLYASFLNADNSNNDNYMTSAFGLMNVGVQPSGKIIIAGKSSKYESLKDYIIVERYLPQGILDTSFADSGILKVDFRDIYHDFNVFSNIIFFDDGSFVVAGNALNVATKVSVLAMKKFDNEGIINLNFGNNGMIKTTSFFNSDTTDLLGNILVQSDNKILLNGIAVHKDSTEVAETNGVLINVRYGIIPDSATIDTIIIDTTIITPPDTVVLPPDSVVVDTTINEELSCKILNRTLFPNPLNHVLNINFELNVECKVSIFIYDMLGKKVLTLRDNENMNGLVEIDLPAESLASGCYFIVIKTKEDMFKQKIIVY